MYRILLYVCNNGRSSDTTLVQHGISPVRYLPKGKYLVWANLVCQSDSQVRSLLAINLADGFTNVPPVPLLRHPAVLPSWVLPLLVLTGVKEAHPSYGTLENPFPKGGYFQMTLLVKSDPSTYGF